MIYHFTVRHAARLNSFEAQKQSIVFCFLHFDIENMHIYGLPYLHCILDVLGDMSKSWGVVSLTLTMSILLRGNVNELSGINIAYRN